jgi:CRISPR-associated endonuclease/helicase Cas3
MYYAHSTDKQDRSDWQPLPEHLKGVGFGAKQRAAKFGVPQAALLAGLGHDLGKYSKDFDRRLSGSTERVDHSTAGAREVMAVCAAGTGEERGLAELAAYAIAGHHAGLPDRNGNASLSVRLHDIVIPPLDPVWRSEVDLGSPGGLPPDFGWHGDKARRPFQIAFLGRMIFSTLIDADRRDTEAFSDEIKGTRSDRHWPALSAVIDEALAKLERRFAAMRQETAEAADGQRDLNALRDEILGHVRRRAKDGCGLFTLTVPTGGGKTLTVTDFALRHAKRWRLDRVVYAIPFTSVIDQTSAILKGVFGEELILEHHSAIDFVTAKEERDFRDRGEGLDLKLRLAMEDWAAPIVITTNVQLFESLFSHRPSRCRRLHNLANSVIILDEAQTIPLKVLRPCIAALDELVRNYGCTVVFCAPRPSRPSPCPTLRAAWISGRQTSSRPIRPRSTISCAARPSCFMREL